MMKWLYGLAWAIAIGGACVAFGLFFSTIFDWGAQETRQMVAERTGLFLLGFLLVVAIVGVLHILCRLIAEKES